MPAISKIRLTNVVYEHGQKRYHDELFLFDGFNGAIVLENGGGKSVFIQTVLQAIIPHTDVGERKVKDTLILDEGPAHIAIEWLLNERPRRYAVTAVTLFKRLNGIDSLRYVYEYGENDPHSIEMIPFVQEEGREKRPSSRGEMSDYYSYMASQSRNAKTFSQSIKSYREYIEEQYHIIGNEWDSIARINGAEGDVEAFFENCKKTNELIDRLLIPSVEKGMAGFHKEVFADMFENRREQFKKYKELKETIDQNKLLSEELAHYVERFRQVDEKEKLYFMARRKAKGYQLYLMEELEGIVGKLAQLEDAFEEWNEEKLRLAMKFDSLSIEQERRLLTEFEEKEKMIRETLTELEEAFQSRKLEYYSLQFARAREEIVKEQENLKLYEQELENLDRNVEVEEWIVELENINGQIHYLFLEMKESIEKELQDVRFEMNQLKGRFESLEEKKGELELERNEWNERLTKVKAEIHFIIKKQKQLKSELVSHEDESIEQLLEEWTIKLQQLDEEKVATVQKMKELGPEIEKQKKLSQNLLQQLLDKKSLLATEEEKKKQFDERHKWVLERLAETLAQWTYIDSVYNRHASIESQIEERLAKLKRQKDRLLDEERVAKRFVDDYAEQEQFFADPYVEKQIQHWNQFEYLVTGIQYVQSVQDEISIDESDYPFWALTLITTEKEKEDVQEKLKSIQHHLKYPIFVISSVEAGQLVKGEKAYEDVVEPALWHMNIDNKRFAEWKVQKAEEAEKKTQERKEVEVSIDHWERTKEHFHQFLKDYPHEKYVELENNIRDLSHEIQNLREEQKKANELVQELEKELKMKESSLHSIEIEMQDLQNRLIPKAIEYTNLSKELHQLQKDKQDYEKQTNDLMEQEKRLASEINRVNIELGRVRDELSGLEIRMLYEVDKNELFTEVKQYSVVRSEMAMNALKTLRHELNNRIHQIQTSRREWESRIDNSQRRIEDLKKDQKRLRNEYDGLDEEYPFPMNGEEKIGQLAVGLRELAGEVKEGSAEWQDAVTKKKVQEDRVNQRVEKFEESYPGHEVIVFGDELSAVEDQLKEERRRLQKRLDYLKQQQELLVKEEAACVEAKQQFERYELVHKLEDPGLEGAMLSDEESREFPYNRKTIVEQLIRELEMKQQAVSDELEVLARAKESYKRFCQQLSDPKIRKNAVEGVETKKTYEEVLNYQQQLEERIDRTIQIAEATIQDYDKEQQQFITYIHKHLQNVREDLLEIAKKTRVRVGDSWKTVYEIQVPDWDEDEAKEKIREHIDWILSQIERESFRDEKGMEDAAKVRQFLEKTLQTVPLLREVIGNQTMKVKCRKVESDEHISNTYYTWEQSNQWSGGEKWSKNMALFLGLLNFIAEKSQHIQPNAKRHRTVILDNPFGKASSDHVLSPVFFIAEQLGFQMIALTAHAEGKFLSDYFPIIYSCKLRHLEGGGGSKQVLTKEKQIQTAYFHDHAPESLVRLGEREQMSLFD